MLSDKILYEVHVIIATTLNHVKTLEINGNVQNNPQLAPATGMHVSLICNLKFIVSNTLKVF